MLAPDAYATWFSHLGLPAAARPLIDHVRTAPPSRHVRASARNVAGRFPSRKMGVTIQFESHQVELAAIYVMEHDPAVLEFYDQPPTIKLTYPDRKGRTVGPLHTADFFLIRDDGAGWEEWKEEKELLRLAERMPGRYVRRDGQWRCPPGEAYAEPFRLFYRVRSSAEIDWTLQRNLRLLAGYMDHEAPAVSPDVRQAVLTRVAGAPGVTLAELVKSIDGVTPDALYTLIVAHFGYRDQSDRSIVITPIGGS